MTTAALADRFYALGFIPGDVARDLSDKPIASLAYLTRIHEGQHQYLSLTSGPWINAPFAEAVLHVYAQPFNSRSKVRQTPLAARILRSVEEIEAAVGRVYPVIK